MSTAMFAPVVMRMESLERRRLFFIITVGPPPPPPPSPEPPTQVATHLTRTGTLVVDGDAGPNIIGMTRKGAALRVVQQISVSDAEPVVTTFPTSAVKRVLIQAGDGNDRVGVTAAVNHRCTLVGGTGSDTLDGGYGDVLYGNAGNDKLFALQHVSLSADGRAVVYETDDGPAALFGGPSNDTLVAGDDDFVVGNFDDDLLLLQRFVGEGEDAGALLRDHGIDPAYVPPEGIERVDLFVRVVTSTGMRRLLPADLA